MREIVLDTETTGFDPETGDRIVEIGAVELHQHLPTGNTYHQYINPERSMPQEAFEVHGLGDDFLRDKPKFEDIGRAFLDFVGDAKLVIHNAAFDMKFLNAELDWMGLPQLPWECAIDTLAIARKRFPGSPASLDALCRRFGIDNSARTLHGALLDFRDPGRSLPGTHRWPATGFRTFGKRGKLGIRAGGLAPVTQAARSSTADHRRGKHCT